MNRWERLALDGLAAFVGSRLADRVSARLPNSNCLLGVLGVGLAASACLLLFQTPAASPILPAGLWRPLVHAAFILVFTFGSTLVGGVLWRSRRSRPVPDSALGEQPSARVLNLVARGRKIEAIRTHREETGLGLRDAKNAVDRASGRGQDERRV